MTTDLPQHPQPAAWLLLPEELELDELAYLVTAGAHSERRAAVAELDRRALDRWS